MTLLRLRYVPMILVGSFLSASICAGFISTDVNSELPNHWDEAKDKLEAGIKAADAEANAPWTKDHLDRLRQLTPQYWAVGAPDDLRAAQNEYIVLYEWDRDHSTGYNPDLIYDLRQLADSDLIYSDFKNAFWAARTAFDYDRENGQEGQLPIAVDWNNLGTVYHLSASVQTDPVERKASFDKAKYCYEQAAGIMKRLNASPSLAPNQYNLSLLEAEMGNYKESRRIEKVAGSYLAESQED